MNAIIGVTAAHACFFGPIEQKLVHLILNQGMTERYRLGLPFSGKQDFVMKSSIL